MKKIRFIFLSILLSISLYIPCFSCFAQGNEWTLEQKIRFFGNGIYKIFTDISGVLLPSGLNGSDLQTDFQAYVLNHDVIQDNMSYDEWIAHEIGISYQNGDNGEADVVYSPLFQNTVNNYVAYWLSENNEPYYVYSWGTSELENICSDTVQYSQLTNFIREHDDSIIRIPLISSYSYRAERIYVYSDIPSEYFWVFASNVNNIECINVSAYSNLINNFQRTVTEYRYDRSSNTYILNNTSSSNNGVSGTFKLNSYLPLHYQGVDVQHLSGHYIFVDSVATQYIVYKSTSQLNNVTQGVQNYYVTDSYNTNNFQNSNNITDSYNTTVSNVNNTVTYSNVADYVNNYYVENNSYPTINNVYNYINNYVPPTDGGGGGSGGSGSDFDWSFLGTIGEFLGGLIEGVGNVLSGILSTLTDVIDMFIGENGLPNVISQLISYFLPFLPEWVPTLIGFSVVLALILGIIKLIRG